MPKKTGYRKRRAKKTNYKRKKVLAKPARTFSSAIHSFKRSRTEVIDLVGYTGQGWTPQTATGNQGIGKTFQFALGDLNDVTDFTNLFKYYRIKAVRVQMFFSNNITAQDEPSRFANSQLMIYTDVNNNGITTGNNDILYYLDSQTSKKTVALTTQKKPFDCLMRMKQSNEIYGAGVPATDYTLQSPKWISTTEVNTPHYGMNMFIGRVDGNELSHGFANTQYVRFIYTYYIQVKKVQ